MTPLNESVSSCSACPRGELLVAFRFSQLRREEEQMMRSISSPRIGSQISIRKVFLVSVQRTCTGSADDPDFLCSETSSGSAPAQHSSLHSSSSASQTRGWGGKPLLWEPSPVRDLCCQGRACLGCCAAARGPEQCGFGPRRV